MLSKIEAIVMIFFFIDAPHDAILENFIMGMAMVTTYSYMLYIAIRGFKLDFSGPSKADLLHIALNNFYLTINNISNNLQQSSYVNRVLGYTYNKKQRNYRSLLTKCSG